MNLSDVFNQQEHDQTIIDCFIEMWRYSADLMFIMAVEKNGEFSLYDNNPASRAVMGLEQGAEIHRLNLRVQFGDEMAEQVYKTYEQVIESGKPTSIEQTGIRGDGSRIYFDTLFVPIFNSAGDPVFVCGVSRDITKIKDAENVALQANEKLLEYSAALESVNQDLDRKVQERTSELETAKRIVEEALEAKSSFVARMSHEIRTPINAVIGLSHLTLKTPLSSSQKDHLHKILASGEVLLRLVNDVLDFSKIEAGKMALEVVPFSLDSIVQYAIDMNSLKAKEKNLSLNVDISKSLPKMLLGDPLRIQQVLVNLVTNAVKFTEYGGVSIRVYSETNIDNEMLLRCDVIDTGIGISKAYSDKLFKAFQQADDSITREFGGTGLGLTISRQLCELMGGDIWVKSEIGQGSTFSFTFPLNNPDSLSNIENHIENEEKNIPDLSAFSVLLAEDNIINQKVILGYLEDTFIKVDVVENGQEAINKLNEQEYDLVLMDIQMPVM
ncbi:MAG: response regulator, partial [Oceanospirillaceae bacterium]|nr:response regulator [Oceanospirillaceae bacterium]